MLASHRISKIDAWPIGRPKLQPRRMEATPDGIDVPIADVEIERRSDGTAAFRAPGVSAPFFFEVPIVVDDPFPPFLLAFTRPQMWSKSVTRGHRTPRIEIDGVVFQRERWDLGADDLPAFAGTSDSFDAFLALWRWKTALELPDQVFFRPRNGPKPVLLDFGSPLVCASFLHLWQSSGGGSFSEMLPGPDELWLRNGSGRYTCELRFNMFRGPEAPRLEPVEAGGVGASAADGRLDASAAASIVAARATPRPTTDSAIVARLRAAHRELERLVTED